MANYNFKKDLQLGVKGEEIVKEFLISKGCKFVKSNTDNRFDLVMLKQNVETTYEIKTDVFCSPDNDTGNMYIEYECRGKLSGIYVTESDWFVTYYKHFNQLWFIKTNELKDLLKKGKIRITENGGDKGSKTAGFLIKRDDYRHHFHIYDISDTK